MDRENLTQKVRVAMPIERPQDDESDQRGRMIRHADDRAAPTDPTEQRRQVYRACPIG